MTAGPLSLGAILTAARLYDDGTLDTVIMIGTWACRFDCEYASQFRKDGALTTRGFAHLRAEAWETYWQLFGR